jgi:hypothetical protein
MLSSIETNSILKKCLFAYQIKFLVLFSQDIYVSFGCVQKFQPAQNLLCSRQTWAGPNSVPLISFAKYLVTGRTRTNGGYVPMYIFTKENKSIEP